MLRLLPKTVDAKRTAPVLYVHPKSQMYLEDIIPISIPAMINRLSMPAVGRFSAEVTREQVRAARLIAMDIHWYLSLPDALALATKMKTWNPEVKIVAGGLTASTFGRQIVRSSDIDYVIRGDGEEPFKALAECTVGGGDPREIPNLLHRDFETAQAFKLTSGLADTLDYLNIDWFPTLQERLKIIHRWTGPRPISTYPYSMGFRGCPLDCDLCMGARGYQEVMFQRLPVRRSAAVVREELEQLSRDSRWRYVNFYHDIVGMTPGRYSEEVFSQPYDLYTAYELYNLPSENHLAMLMESFRGGIIIFSLDRFHITSTKLCDIDGLIARIQQVQKSGRYRARLAYDKLKADIHPHYMAGFEKVVSATGCGTWEASMWYSNYPGMDKKGNGSDEEYAHYAANHGKRYPFFNVAARAGLMLQRYMPGMVCKVSETLMHHGLLRFPAPRKLSPGAASLGNENGVF